MTASASAPGSKAPSSKAPSSKAAGVFRTLRDTPLSARVVLGSVFLSQIAAFIQLFLILFLIARGFRTAQAGLALGFFSVGAIFGTFGGGALADLLGPRWTIVLSTAGQGLFTVALPLTRNLAAVCAASALAGAGARSATTASATLLFQLVPKERRVMMSAMRMWVTNGGLVVAPLLGAVLSAISWNLLFWVEGSAALAYSAVCAFVLRDARLVQEVRQASAGQQQAGQSRAGYLDILRDRKYLVYLLLMLVNGLVYIQFWAILPLMLLSEHYHTWAYASLNAVAATLGFTLQLVVTRSTQTWPAWLAVMGGWMLLVTGRAALGLPGGLVILYIAMLIGIAGPLIGGPAAFAHPVQVAPPGASARYIGFANAAFQLGSAIGPIAGVLLWTHIGKAVWLIILALGVVITPPGIWSLRQPAPVPAQAPVRSG